MAIDEARREGDAVRVGLRPLRRFKRLLLAAVAAGGIGMLALPAAASSAQFVWNVTPSAPAGLYRIVREPWSRGDRVAVLPDDVLGVELDQSGVLAKDRLLIKRLAAVGGDNVCRQDSDISINGKVVAKARRADSHGTRLPAWQGCVQLDDDQVFLLGDTPDSYDGRYFGVTAGRDIVGRVSLLLSL